MKKTISVMLYVMLLALLLTGCAARTDNQAAYEEVVAPTAEYDKVYSFYNGYANVVDNEEVSLIDTQGNVVIAAGLYDDIIDQGELTLQTVKKGDKYGIIDAKDGSIVLPLEYAFAAACNDGNFVVKNAAEQSAIIDKNGKVLLDYGVYDNIKAEKADGVYIVAQETAAAAYAFGAVRADGTVILAPDPKFADCLGYTDGVMIMLENVDGTGKYRMYDQNGKLIEGFELAYASDELGATAVMQSTFYNDLAIYWTNQQSVAVNKKGETVCAEYSYMSDFFSGYAEVGQGGEWNVETQEFADCKYGLIDKDFNVIVPIGTYDYVNYPDQNGYCSVQKDGKWGIIKINKQLN